MLHRLLNKNAQKQGPETAPNGLSEGGAYKHALLEGERAEDLVRHYLQNHHNWPDRYNLG